MRKKTESYLEDLTEADLELSKNALALLQGKKIVRFRFNSIKKEVYIELEEGTRLFIDNIQDKYDISITGGHE